MEYRVCAPRGPRPQRKAGLGTQRWEREYRRWHRDQTPVRTDCVSRHLPDVLDEKPKAWLTRALVHEEDIMVTDEVPPRRAEEGNAAALGDVLEATGLAVTRAKLADLNAELASIEAAGQKDREKQQSSAAARSTLYEAERARFARELVVMQDRRLVANELELEAAAAIKKEETRCQVVVATHQEPVTLLDQDLCATRSEVRHFAEYQDQLENDILSKEFALQARLKMLKPQLEDVQRDQQALAWEARTQRVFYRWEVLCDLLLEREICEALEDDEQDIVASTCEAVSAAEAWRNQSIADMITASAEHAEVGLLRTRASQLGSEVEKVLADFLSLAWTSLPRAITPR